MAFISIPGAHNAVPLGGSPSSNTADQKCASLPASCDRWTADPRFPWLRRFSRLHRELSARLGRLPPWRRRKRSGLRDDVATGARSGRPVRSSLGPTPAAATWLPAHAGEARGEGRPTVTLREPHRCFQELRKRLSPSRHLPPARQASEPRQQALLVTPPPLHRKPHSGVPPQPASRSARRESTGPRTTTPTLPRVRRPLAQHVSAPRPHFLSFRTVGWLIDSSLGEASRQSRPSLLRLTILFSRAGKSTQTLSRHAAPTPRVM